jgi:hypothetical protein
MAFVPRQFSVTTLDRGYADHVLPVTAITSPDPGCVIQSDYGTGIHKSFELAGMYGPSQLTALAFHGAAVRIQQ